MRIQTLGVSSAQMSCQVKERLQHCCSWIKNHPKVVVSILGFCVLIQYSLWTRELPFFFSDKKAVPIKTQTSQNLSKFEEASLTTLSSTLEEQIDHYIDEVCNEDYLKGYFGLKYEAPNLFNSIKSFLGWSTKNPGPFESLSHWAQSQILIEVVPQRRSCLKSALCEAYRKVSDEKLPQKLTLKLPVWKVETAKASSYFNKIKALFNSEQLFYKDHLVFEKIVYPYPFSKDLNLF